MNFYILDHNNTPKSVSIKEWQRFWHNDNNSLRETLASTTINDMTVITFFHKLFEPVHEIIPPALFETYVYDESNGTVYEASYRTWEDAYRGHTDAVKWAEWAMHRPEQLVCR